MNSFEDGSGNGTHESPRELLPVCPYCKMDPAQMVSRPMRFSDLLVAVFYCSNPACRKIVAVAPVGLRQPRQEESMLVRPI